MIINYQYLIKILRVEDDKLEDKRTYLKFKIYGGQLE